ncbi:MAG: DUF2065 domain-containing protein [Halieaceae bacterium]|nr:DUF2065 domain-containing protein [Halieaceae bacterium]
MWQYLAVAIAMVLIIEGMIPFISPGAWRRMVQSVASLDNRSMRIIGLSSMLLGVALLYLVN